MSREIDRELSRQFDAAERSLACLHAADTRLRRALERRVQAGVVVSPHRSLYARAAYWAALRPDEQMLHIIRSLQQAHPTWIFCRQSAGIVWGLPISYRALAPVHVVTGSHGQLKQQGLEVHVLREESVQTVRGVRVTTLVRTVFDCLRQATFVDGLAIADRALRICEPSRRHELRSELRRLAYRRTGGRRVVGIMGYADPKSESWAESAARAHIIMEGFALPKLQVPFEQPFNPGHVYYVDMLFMRADGSQVIGEVDGLEKYWNPAMLAGRSTARVLANEQHRESELTMYGMPVMRISFDDIMHPAQLYEKLSAYNIPQSDRAAESVRRWAKSSPGSAVFFSQMPLPEPEESQRFMQDGDVKNGRLAGGNQADGA